MPTCLSRLFCVVLLIGLLPIPALAQFSLSPMTYQTVAERGMAGGFIQLTNEGSEVEQITLGTGAFTYAEDGYRELASSPQDLSPYIIFSPKELKIPPGQSRRVRWNARFLPSTPSGEYRCMIFAQGAPLAGQEGVRVGVIPRIGAAVYVSLGELEADPQVRLAEYRAQRVDLQVQNDGRATVRPRIDWTLEHADTEIDAGSSPAQTVIAEGRRTLHIVSEAIQHLQPGTYRLHGVLRWGEMDDRRTPFDLDFSVPTSPQTH